VPSGEVELLLAPLHSEVIGFLEFVVRESDPRVVDPVIIAWAAARAIKVPALASVRRLYFFVGYDLQTSHFGLVDL